MKLTENFSLEEFERSDTATKYGICNKIPSDLMENVQELAKLLQVIRKYWGSPIKINSGFRSPELNKKVGGAKNSSHLYAAAADITATNKKDNAKLFNLIKTLMDRGIIEFRSLIWEKGDKNCPSWIHLDINCDQTSYRKNKIIFLY